MEKTLSLSNIQFYWRVTEKPNYPPNVVPDFLPFEFYFEEDIQLLRQKTSKTVLDALHTIYLEEFNVGYLQEGHALAESYGNDVLAFISSAIKKHNPNARSIMEVGCGGGYMLRRFREMGLTVCGVDPSPVAVDKGKEFGYEVYKDFYPTTLFTNTTDIIFHYDVLEHIDDPAAFLAAHKQNLTENGMLMLAVPDDTECIKQGDVSMVIHEHINYFDEESLKNLMEKAGFEVLSLEKSNHGGVLYCAARVNNADKFIPKKGSEKFDSFVANYHAFKSNLTNYIQTVLSDPQNTIGIYIILRMCPYLSDVKETHRLRIFDDDYGLHHKYYDGFPMPVENREDLAKNPVTHLIIASHSFGTKIKARVMESCPQKMEIKLLSDFTK